MASQWLRSLGLTRKERSATRAADAPKHLKISINRSAEWTAYDWRRLHLNRDSLPRGWSIVPPSSKAGVVKGCCRPPAPIPFSSFITGRVLAPAINKPQMSLYSTELRLQGKLIDQRPLCTSAHEWLYIVTHSHSVSFFHGIFESAPRIMWGLNLLRQNPQMKVLHNSPFVANVLDMLNLTGRGVLLHARQPSCALGVTIPPPPTHFPFKPMLSMLLQAAGVARAAVTTHSDDTGLSWPKEDDAPSTKRRLNVIVVRRKAWAPAGGRAMLNHDELMYALRFSILPTRTTLEEWTFDEKPLQEAIATWGRMNVAIAPHGAGLTNMAFMPPHSFIIEIIVEGQSGAVYAGLAKRMEHTYKACTYTRSRLLNRSNAFILDVEWFKRCLADVPWLTAAH